MMKLHGNNWMYSNLCVIFHGLQEGISWKVAIWSILKYFAVYLRPRFKVIQPQNHREEYSWKSNTLILNGMQKHTFHLIALILFVVLWRNDDTLTKVHSSLWTMHSDVSDLYWRPSWCDLVALEAWWPCFIHDGLLFENFFWTILNDVRRQNVKEMWRHLKQSIRGTNEKIMWLCHIDNTPVI